MSVEYERDLDVQGEEQEQAREEIRRLFERYRTIGRRQEAAGAEAEAEEEPVLTPS
jgi:hypothetical protein